MSRLLETRTMAPDGADAPDAPTGAVPVVRLRDVWKTYKSSSGPVEVLRGITLDIQRGEFVVIRGISGSGKSTLLNLIGGIDGVTRGTLIACDSCVSDMNPGELEAFRRYKVGFVFQFYNLLPTLTALENVMVGLEATGVRARTAADTARGYLDAVGLADKVHQLPEQLSGGEQQRVAIARALAKRPPLVLADEPTGSLDEATSLQVLELLQALQTRHHASVVLATHNAALSDYADRTLLLRKGVLSELCA